MVALGKEASANIYKHLTEEEVAQITLSITGLRAFDTNVKNSVIEEFYEICVAQNYIVEGGIDYARDVLVKAMGEEKADDLIGRLSASLQVRPFSFIKKANPTHLLSFVQNEHPQTIALILSYIEPSKAAHVVANLPVDVQADVITRVATMSTASPEYIREAERILERKLMSVNESSNMSAGGIDSVVAILNAVDRTTEKNILSVIEAENTSLADDIHKRMFVFEDILKLSDVVIQKILKDVDNDVLAIALKGASADISKKIFANISKRLQDILKENMDYMGPVRVRDVEQAQQKIVGVIRKLEEAGEIDVARGGEDEALIV